MGWKNKINKTLERKKRDEGSYKIKKEHIHIQFIKEIFTKNNTISMEQLHKLIINNFKSLEISKQYLSDIIRR